MAPEKADKFFTHFVTNYIPRWIIWRIKLNKTAWIGIQTANQLLLLGNADPHPVSVLREIKMFSFQSFHIDSYMNVSMLSNHVLKFKCWLQICTKKTWITIVCVKRLQLLWYFVPQTSYHVLHFTKIKQFSDIKYYMSIFFNNVVNWALHGFEPCMTLHVIIYFKRLPQICTKMNGFKFDFSKNFPDPSTRFFLWLHPRFELCPQFSGALRLRLGLRPSFSGTSRPRFGLRPQLSIGELDLPPQ